MKKLFLTSILLFIIFCHSQAQNFNPVRKYYDSLEEKMIVCDKDTKDCDTLLMTGPGINVFMARKVNTYLTGSGDLALNKSYFIVDPTDGKLFLGGNVAKDPFKGSGFTRMIYTFGVKANVEEAFSTIYKDKKFEKDIGASVKATWLGRGVIQYSVGKKQRQNKDKEELYPQYQDAAFYREQLREEMDSLMKKDSLEFRNKTRRIKDIAYVNSKWKDYCDEQSKHYRTEYVKKEADYIIDEKLYNAFWNYWISADFYIPFTTHSFQVADSYTSTISEKEIYNTSGTLLVSGIYERKKIRLLSTVSYGLKYQNNIYTSILEKHSVSQYRNLGGTDTLTLAQIETSDVYIGPYKDYWTSSFGLQAVCFFIAKKTIGLSINIEKSLGVYDPLNMKLGIPFTLAGKDEETKADFELQFKFNDLNNAIYPDKSIGDKFVIGISVAVPLTSKIY